MIYINKLEQKVLELEDRIARLERDNEDAISNLDMSNFGSALTNTFNDMRKRISALENASNAS